MGVDSTHPLYDEHLQEWEQIRDTLAGERVVKEAGFKYLPPTSGMVADGAKNGTQTRGFHAYEAYRARARFPEVVNEAVEAMLGVMHHKEATIMLPEALEGMRGKATLKRESLQALLRRINEEQLGHGRLGLLLEFVDGEELPHIALYRALDIRNWDEGERDSVRPDSLNMVVLDESEDERIDDFEWEFVEKYRVLSLGDLEENEGINEGAAYSVGVWRSESGEGADNFTEEKLVQPRSRIGTLNRIPFVFINTKDVVPTPDQSTLLGLSNLALTIYRGEADYRQALFLQGQDTLVTIGAPTDDDTLRVGTGSHIALPIGGDAKFIGVDSQGLPEVRESLQNDYAHANQKANALLEAVSRSAESGEALRVRVSARTASLNQIAQTGAFALQELLRIAAEWIGANPEEVIIEPNLDFVSDRLEGQTMVQYMTAKQLGAPWTWRSLHNVLFERGLTTMNFEDEVAEITREKEQGLDELFGVSGGSTNEDGPEPDEEEDPEEDETEDDEEDQNDA